MAYVIKIDCIACGACMPECPVEAISEGDIFKIDPKICTDCGTCSRITSYNVCYTKLLRIKYNSFNKMLKNTKF